MADDSEITALTHYIPVDVFLGMIEGDIKKLIHEYGHKNCGLKHEELCTELKKFINQKKKLELSVMDEKGKKKWDSEWRKKKNGFLKKLFKEEGFIYTCDSNKNANNPSLNQLLSKHIQFCKEKDERLSDLGKNPEYDACRQYNIWINGKTTSFTREYLENVRDYKIPTVKKYFITKEHPEGYDPLTTYHGVKLNCEIYNPQSRSYQPIAVENTPPKILHTPTAPVVRKESRGNGESSMRDRGGRIEKTKFNVKHPPEKKPPPDSLTSPLPNKKVDGTANGHDVSVKSKVSASLVNVEGPKNEKTPMHHQPPTSMPTNAQAEAPPKDSTLQPVVRLSPSPTESTSLSSSLSTVKDTISSQTPATSSNLTITPASSVNSGLSSPSDPLPSAVATKDQGEPPHSITAQVTSTNTHSIHNLPAPSDAVSSLAPPQLPAMSTPPAVTAVQSPGTSASSSAITVTTTRAASDAVTLSTVNTTGEPISSVKQAPSVSSSPGPPSGADASEPKATAATTAIDPQQIVVPVPTSYSGSDTEIISVRVKPDRDSGTKSSKAVSLKPKGTIQATDDPLSNHTQQNLVHSSRTHTTTPDINPQKTSDHTNQHIKPNAFPNQHTNGVISQTFNTIGASVNTPNVKTSTTSKDSNNVRNKENANSNIEPEGLPPLINIIPIILIILTSFTALFLLYKYTPFGFLLGRRRKRKKHDLKRIFETPGKSAYESPNITVHEWEDPNLVGKAVENDVNIKLLKINRYKQKIQKRKKENKKTLIEVHMEVLEEYKSDEWELHKGDFLEICLRGFINEENETYQKFPNSKLTINNTNEKTIEDIQKKEILWNNWIENHRNILEQWKKEDWFQNLKNEWKNEEQMYKEKNDKLQKNISNEQDTHSIVSQKEIWKQWISKQATLIGMFNKEDWFKSIIYAQDKEKDNCRINEYNNISVTSKTELKNEKTNEEGRSKNIIQKLMVQIHMMVLEECIKEDIIKHKELCIDNFIDEMHNNNNNDEKRNIPQCDTDDFNVLEYEEIHTSRNK